MSKLPIDKQYLISSFKDFYEKILNKEFLKSNDKSLHSHDNKKILDKISVSDSNTLLYDGKEICFGGNNSTTSNGKSAYEIAKDNGFEGTETQWLESLKGEPGEPGKDADVSDIDLDDIGAAKAEHTHGYVKIVTLSTTEPTTVTDGEIVMVYEE